MKRACIIITTAALVVLAASIGAWRVHHARRAQQRALYRLTAHEQRILEKSRATLDAVKITPIDRLIDSPGSLNAAIEAIEIIPPAPGTSQIAPPLDRDQIAAAGDALRTLTLDFIVRRLLDRDVDHYIAWRHSRGDVARPMDGKEFQIPAMYEIWMGEPMPPNTSSEQAFRAVYARFESDLTPINQLKAISTGPDAMVMKMWWEHPHIMLDRPRYEQLIGLSDWIQSQYSGQGSWFIGAYDDPRSSESMRVQLHALVGFLAGYADGSRHPIVLMLRWEPESKHWVFDHLTYSDTPTIDENRLVF